MAAQPKNAASEYIRTTIGYLNEIDSPPSGLRSGLTDDFTFEDRRTHAPTFPDLDAESGPKAVATLWDTGAGRPRFTVHEVLAVRGDRFVACRLELDYGNGWTGEYIEVIELDANMVLLQRLMFFDPDDVDAANAELDRLHGQSDTR